MHSKSKRIVFFHPDLGIGGAERLIIDAAVGLQNLGHKVTIFTSYCNQSHCFDEARDGTLDVRVRGDSIIPPKFIGSFSILCAILRQFHLIFQIAILSSELQDLSPDAFFVDQLSAGIPLLRLRLPNTRTFFYCHFPDKLLAQRASFFKRAYRVPFDWFEGWTTGISDMIAVNSKFTKSIFARAFPLLKNRDPIVVYPCVDVGEVDQNKTKIKDQSKPQLWEDRIALLSINRFERKKGVELAIKAFAQLSVEERKGARLVLAGGHDPRMAENVEYHHELERLADSFDLKHATLKNVVTALSIPSEVEVLFLLSVPSVLKATLLQSSTMLLYTPPFEHFGIVPLEAMLAQTPVLAADVGGPTETVKDGVTGFLRNVDNVDAWADVMRTSLKEESHELFHDMGRNGRKWVEDEFSQTQMALRIQRAINDMLSLKQRPRIWSREIIVIILGMGALTSILAAWLLKEFTRVEEESQRE